VEIVNALAGPEVRALEGVHLFHYGMSNCSQKVVMCLAEKGVAWTGHHVDLARLEQMGQDFLTVNPRGAVPVLVHDGKVIVESSDIMSYLDGRFPDPPLHPESDAGRTAMRLWVARQDSIQYAIRTLSYEFLFDGAGRLGDEDLARYEQLVKNSELLAFHRDLASGAGGAPAAIAGAVRAVEQAFGELNRQVGTRQWVVGDRFTLADIAWVVTVHRFARMRFPMARYPALRKWFRRARRRTSFRTAVLAQETPTVRRGFRRRILRRWLTGSHVGAAKWRRAALLANA
jgi:ganglioside-induced differentiation-associated protein 1